MKSITVTRYTGVAIGLHWLMAALIVAGFALGWTVADMEFSPQKLRWMSWHKWLGITVLGLVALRLLWRLTHSAPPLPTVPLWQRGAAHAFHLLLYGLMFAIPLSGWLYSADRGRISLMGKAKQKGDRRCGVGLDLCLEFCCWAAWGLGCISRLTNNNYSLSK